MPTSSLRAITERLRTIEDQIATQNKNIGSVPASSNTTHTETHVGGSTYGFDADITHHTHTSNSGLNGNIAANDDLGEMHDPVSTVSIAIKDLDHMLSKAGSKLHAARTSGSASPNSPFSGQGIGSDKGSSPRTAGSVFSAAGGSGSKDQRDKKPSYEPDVPDAISRGFVTVEEAQQLFDFYFQRCAQWTPPLESHNDRNMYHVRRRSTFLFH